MKLNIKSQFIKSLTILASGSVLAQLIVIIASPIITRLYSPAEIGDYTLVLTAVGLFGSVICARYDMAIVPEVEEGKVYALVVLSLAFTIILSVAVTICYAVYYLIQGYTLIKVLFCCLFILILLIMNGISNILISFNNRCREYKLMTSVNLIRSAAKEAFMIGGGLMWPTSWVLVTSEIIGTIFGIRRQSLTLRKNTNNLQSLKKITKYDLIEVGKKHKKQALLSTPALFANNFSYSSINIFINSLFGNVTLGLYSVSYRLLGLPLNIISSNVSRIYMEEASRAYEEEGNYERLFKRTSIIMVIIAIPMTALLILLSPWFCSLFFGEKYYVAGIYLRFLAPMFGIRFIVSPLTVGMIISQKQNYELVFQVAFVAVSVILFIMAKIAGWSIESYLLTIGCSYALIYIVFYVFLFKFSKNDNTR